MSSVALPADNITELVLSNGLKIIVKPDHRSPVAVFQIWYKVGSGYEREGITGVSHMLEHLMFKRNNNIVLGEAFNQLHNIGARGNAYTSRDHTFFYHLLEKKYLALAFAVEAERMQHLSPSIKDFNIEKKVIREELQSCIGREPYLPAYNALYKLAFQQNGYQFPVLGRPQDLDFLTLENTLSWYNNHYAPDNASIVVVGDIKAAEVFALARKHFASISKKAQPVSHRSDAKTTKKAASRFIMSESTRVGAILLAFKVPSIKTSMPAWEAYALEVLAGWFDSGTNSRLTSALIRDRQLAHEITVQYSPMVRQHSLFIIEALPAQNVTLQQLEQALDEELQKIKNELISQQTLKKIKNQMIATEIFDRDSIYTQAEIIGQAESVGIHWSEDAQYIERIKAVTAEQVKKVLHKYFITEKKFVVLQDLQYVGEK